MVSSISSAPAARIDIGSAAAAAFAAELSAGEIGVTKTAGCGLPWYSSSPALDLDNKADPDVGVVAPSLHQGARVARIETERGAVLKDQVQPPVFSFFNTADRRLLRSLGDILQR